MPRLPAFLEVLKERVLRAATWRRGVSRTVNGMNFRVDSRTRVWFSGQYDAGAARELTDRVKPGDEVWNAGANVGVYVLQLARLVGPSGRVVAFEPAPDAADLLWRNVCLNGFSDRVTLVRAAVGEQAGEVEFFADGSSPLGRPGHANPLVAQPRVLRVPVVTLDQVWRERGTTPNAIVMDIEGFEVGALLSGLGVLTAAPASPWLIVELHPDAWAWSGHTAAQLREVLRAAGMRVTPLSGQTDALSAHGQVLLESGNG